MTKDSACPGLSGLTRRFRALDISDGGFSHRDQEEVAFDLLRVHDFAQANAIFAGTIKTMTERLGIPEKFNTTITLAFLGLIAERASAATYVTFDAFLAENSDLMDRNILGSWYSEERLCSDTARRTFVLPDRFAP